MFVIENQADSKFQLTKLDDDEVNANFNMEMFDICGERANIRFVCVYAQRFFFILFSLSRIIF